MVDSARVLSPIQASVPNRSVSDDSTTNSGLGEQVLVWGAQTCAGPEGRTPPRSELQAIQTHERSRLEGIRWTWSQIPRAPHRELGRLHWCNTNGANRA
eukprot:9529446-Alexandrium_andersonii.AAC.1